MNLPQPIQRLARQKGYQRPPLPASVDLRLDGNEGALAAPEALDQLAQQDPELLRTYPKSTRLTEALAMQHDVPAEQLLVLAGGDEVLDRAFRAYTEPSRNAVWPEPSFEMLPHYARLSGCEVRNPEWMDGPFPLDDVLEQCDANTGVVVVVSPNNPTGAIATGEQLRQIAEAVPQALVVLDHAYVEFADDDLTTLALTMPNVVVLRTLSKAFGLAGLRVGYALGHPEVIATLRAAGGPYSVAGPSLRLAELALGAEVQGELDGVKVTRTALTSLLRDQGFEVQPSQGNFVLARGPRHSWLHDGLRGLGIAVRAFPTRKGLEDTLRITCPGAAELRERLLSAVRTVLAPQAILFDLDGVLADVSQSYRRAIQVAAEHFGAELTPQDIAEFKRRGDANNDWIVTHRMLAERGIDVAYEDVVERFEAVYQGAGDTPGLHEIETTLYPVEAFERLAQRVPVGIVTGRPLGDAQRFLEQHGYARCLKCLVTMHDAPAKPSPEPVRLALQQLGLERAWLLGDTVDDLVAARTAGVVPLGVPAPGEDRARARDHLLQMGAARVLENPADIESLLTS